MAIDAGIFRAYDIRGKVGPSITPKVAFTIFLLVAVSTTRRASPGPQWGDRLRLPSAGTPGERRERHRYDHRP